MNRLAFVLASSILLTAPNFASAGQWVTLGDTGFVSGDPTLTLTMPSVFQPSLSVRSSIAGDLKWIETNVPLTLNEVFKSTKRIDKVMVCYNAPNSGSYISQIRLAQYSGPSTASVLMDDGTDLTSATDACYISSFAPIAPKGGAVSLSLRLTFGNPADKIWIGATAVHFK